MRSFKALAVGATVVELSWAQVRRGEWGVQPVPAGGARMRFALRGDLLYADLVAIENWSRLFE